MIKNSLFARCVYWLMSSVLTITLFIPAISSAQSFDQGGIRRGYEHYDPEAEQSGGPCNVSGAAADVLKKQPELDSRWINVIVKEGAKANADPLAMASVLYWENRKFPGYEPKSAGNANIGFGPWQIIAGTWASHAQILPEGERAYSNATLPEISTKVAADIVQSYGGKSGVPLGSINQNFGKIDGKPANLPSIATFAKNYNAGQATWRDPGEAGHLQAGRIWHEGSRGNWANRSPSKPKIIDDYIVAVTYVYYKLAKGEPLPKSGTDPAFFSEALANQDKLRDFSFTNSDAEEPDGDPVASCGDGAVQGEVVATALNLAWNTKGHGKFCADAKPTYATAGPGDRLNGGALFEFNNQAQHTDLCSDCGVFVATVMKASGVDPNYPARGTTIQRPYLEEQARAGKYKRIELSRNAQQDTSVLQPGDILITTSGLGHTQIYVGNQTGPNNSSYNVASASLYSYVPQASNHYQGGSYGQFFVAFRKL